MLVCARASVGSVTATTTRATTANFVNTDSAAPPCFELHQPPLRQMLWSASEELLGRADCLAAAR